MVNEEKAATPPINHLSLTINHLSLTIIMLITNHTITYATHRATDTSPKVPAALKNDVHLDVYQRSDGSTATRHDLVEQAAAPVNHDDQQFRELLHKFIGQTMFGMMLKSMRATQEPNPFFHGGRAEEIYQGLLDMELTEQLTQATTRTLSEPMYKLMKAPRTV